MGTGVFYQGKELSEQEREDLRFKCKVDLFFLAHDILGYDQLTELTHRQLAEFFVQKDPNRGLHEQDPVKTRLLLFPRYGFKSTMNIADCIQWILCFPFVRILVLTGEKDLANGFVDETQAFFIMDEDATPTLFQSLFPEFCIRPKDKRIGKFFCPIRGVFKKEPTLMASSIESTLPGWHPDVLKGDDVVNNINSEEEVSAKKIIRKYRLARKTVHPKGYKELIGTRYGPFDLYGETIKKAKPGKLKVLCKAAWWLKTESVNKPEDELGEDDYELLFPELLTYEFLCDERDDDPEGFQCQYLNNPMGGQEPTFPKVMLLQATVPHKKIPAHGEMFIAWRFAYPGKQNMQYAAGVVGLLDGFKMFIVDGVHGKFTPSKLAFKVVEQARKWGVQSISIEETPGARFLEDSIKNYALTMNWKFTINWIPFQEDDGARELRIKHTEPLINSMRLLFADNVGCLDSLHDQFENFMLMQDASIPDAVSLVAQWLPRSIAAAPAAEQAAVWKQVQEQDLYDRVMGLGRYAEDLEIPEVEAAPEIGTSNPLLSDIMPGLNG